MTFEQELDAYFHDLEIGAAEERGEARGEERITGLNAWLFSNNRDEDVKLASKDKAHLEKLLKEYDKYIESTKTVKV